ncbi:MAG: hypothetical protein IKF82_00905 [Bacilli bacterium]|nr:hypothetical protein [Bacilli bacterium]
MTRELEVLNWLLANETIYKGRTRLTISPTLRYIKQRLEQIDNANPNEALEETLRDIAYDLENDDNPFLRDRYYGLLDVKQSLIKAQEQEKVLKIIFRKTVGIFQLSCCKNVYEYNDLKFNDYEKLTQEEFELLKRWSENGK